MAELTAAAGLVREFIGFAASRSADGQELIRRAGIGDDLTRQNGRTAVRRFRTAMHLAIEQTGDPALALRYGQGADLALVSVVGLLIQACPTLIEAVAQLNRFHPLFIEVNVASGLRFELQHSDSGAWLVDRRIDAEDWPELTDLTFGWFASMTRHLAPSPIFKAVHCTHSMPKYREEYERVFRAAVEFGAPRNALLIEERRLTQPFALQPQYAFEIFREHADRLLAKLATPESISVGVERLLVMCLPNGAANVNSIASKMGISRQTLFRRLRGEGASFEQLLHDTRRRLAIKYLSDLGLSVGDTAHELGFSDRSAFSRAFKRWMGSNPSDFRGR